MEIAKRIENLRELMKKNSIDYYIIPSSDYHQSEYVGNYFKSREWISGFTGSAGTILITLEEAGLWTDGRYFIQAEKQLLGSGITLFKTGEEGVPTLNQYIKSKIKNNETIGFDGKVLATNFILSLQDELEDRAVNFNYRFDLIIPPQHRWHLGRK